MHTDYQKKKKKNSLHIMNYLPTGVDQSIKWTYSRTGNDFNTMSNSFKLHLRTGTAYLQVPIVDSTVFSSTSVCVSSTFIQYLCCMEVREQGQGWGEYKPTEYNMQFKSLQFLRRSSSEWEVLTPILPMNQSHLCGWMCFFSFLL